VTTGLLAAWNAWLLVSWVGRFHVMPAELSRAFVSFFLERRFSWPVLAENWAVFVPAGAALAGLLSLVARMGRRVNALVWPGRDALRDYLFGLGPSAD